MSAGAYALLRFADTEKLLPAIEHLSTLDSVEQWHAVDGHYHLILKISSPDQDFENALAALDGLEFRQLCVVRESSGTFTVDPELTAAYVFLELGDNGAEEAIQSKDLSFASLAFTDCGAIGILQRPTFEDVDRVVESALRSLDGVLRVKRDWIIDLTQL